MSKPATLSHQVTDVDDPTPDHEPARTAAVAAPGWYADPENPERMRWWDGTAWAAPLGADGRWAGTAHVATEAGTAHGGQDGARLNPSQISNRGDTRYAQILQPDEHEPVDSSDVSRSAMIAIVAGVAVVVVALVVVGVLLLTGSDDSAEPDNLAAESVAAELEAAGLPVGEVEVYTQDTDPDGLLGRPGLYISRADFADTTVDDDAAGVGAESGGGTIEVYETDEEAEDRAAVLATRADARVAQAGPVLIRLSPAVPQDDVSAYRRALEARYAGTDTIEG